MSIEIFTPNSDLAAEQAAVIADMELDFIPANAPVCAPLSQLVETTVQPTKWRSY